MITDLIFLLPGIGRDICKALVTCGAEVYAVSRTQSDLDSLVAEVIFSPIVDILIGFYAFCPPLCPRQKLFQGIATMLSAPTTKNCGD